MVFLGFSFVFFCFLLFFLLAEGIITIGRTQVLIYTTFKTKIGYAELSVQPKFCRIAILIKFFRTYKRNAIYNIS